MAERTLRVLIVDDELLARQHIADRLAHEPNVEVVGTAADGVEAIEAIRNLKPDVVFLDVQMPRATGLDVVDAIGPEEMPATIFVTAYDRYALKAFDAAAVDYLLKPFDDERFAEAFRRARRGQLTKKFGALLQAADEGAGEYIDRITVEQRGQTRVVPVKHVDYITASGPYAELHVGGRTFAVRERMQTLAAQLDPKVFMRVHRSAIVRLDRIETMLRSAGGDYAVRLKDGTELSVSRARREALEARLGVS
jgi:two-component system LytT family response regulator